MPNNPVQNLFQVRNKIMDKIKGADAGSMSYIPRLGLYTIRIFFAILRDLKDGQLNLRAMSLVYTTLLSLAPLLAISFSVLKSFGADEGVKERLGEFLQTFFGETTSIEITTKIIGFVDNIKVGVLGAVGLGLLLYSVISLMQKIERVFNYTWNVSEGRQFSARFSDYLSVLLVGPLLMFVSVGIKTSISNAKFIEDLTGLQFFGDVSSFVALVMPWLFLTGAFAFIYIFMPNTRVRVVPALVGGAVTALMWKMLGFLFLTFVVGSASYDAIYSAFATLILFMIWMYLGWLVMLIGASIAYYVQNPSSQTLKRGSMKLSIRVREKLGLMICWKISNSFYNNKKGYCEENMSHELRAPILAVRRIVDILEAGGIITETKDNKSIYVPARPFDETSIADVLNILSEAHEKNGIKSSKILMASQVDAILTYKDNTIQDSLSHVTLKDFVVNKDIENKLLQIKTQKK